MRTVRIFKKVVMDCKIFVDSDNMSSSFIYNTENFY